MFLRVDTKFVGNFNWVWYLSITDSLNTEFSLVFFLFFTISLRILHVPRMFDFVASHFFSSYKRLAILKEWLNLFLLYSNK